MPRDVWFPHIERTVAIKVSRDESYRLASA